MSLDNNNAGVQDPSNEELVEALGATGDESVAGSDATEIENSQADSTPPKDGADESNNADKGDDADGNDDKDLSDDGDGEGNKKSNGNKNIARLLKQRNESRSEAEKLREENEALKKQLKATGDDDGKDDGSQGDDGADDDAGDSKDDTTGDDKQTFTKAELDAAVKAAYEKALEDKLDNDAIADEDRSARDALLADYPDAKDHMSEIEKVMEDAPSLSYEQALRVVAPNIAIAKGAAPNAGNESADDLGGRSNSDLRHDQKIEDMTTDEMEEFLKKADSKGEFNDLYGM